MEKLEPCLSDIALILGIFWMEAFFGFLCVCEETNPLLNQIIKEQSRAISPRYQHFKQCWADRENYPYLSV